MPDRVPNTFVGGYVANVQVLTCRGELGEDRAACVLADVLTLGDVGQPMLGGAVVGEAVRRVDDALESRPEANSQRWSWELWFPPQAVSVRPTVTATVAAAAFMVSVSSACDFDAPYARVVPALLRGGLLQQDHELTRRPASGREAAWRHGRARTELRDRGGGVRAFRLGYPDELVRRGAGVRRDGRCERRSRWAPGRARRRGRSQVGASRSRRRTRTRDARRAAAARAGVGADGARSVRGAAADGDVRPGLRGGLVPLDEVRGAMGPGGGSPRAGRCLRVLRRARVRLADPQVRGAGARGHADAVPRPTRRSRRRTERRRMPDAVARLRAGGVRSVHRRQAGRRSSDVPRCRPTSGTSATSGRSRPT